jgi:rhamnosyltransferase subunit B
LILDPLLSPAINDLRAEVGLTRIRKIFGSWRHSPQLILGMFPDWFATAHDWPAHFHRVGFPLYDQSEQHDLPWDLRGFLEDGSPPVVITFGSAMRLGADYFAAALNACQQLQLRCVVLTRSREQLPSKLPPEIFHADYAPFSQVFPRARLVIHHGGIGTIAQCLAAAVPQLVMPLAFDQPDNAARLERLGVARSLDPRKFQPQRIIPVLQELCTSRQVAIACRLAQTRILENNAIQRACQLIECLQSMKEHPWAD